MISLIVLSLILMLLRYRPIDHVSHIIGQARAPPAARLFLQKRRGPSSFVLIGPRVPQGGGETDKDRGGGGGREGDAPAPRFILSLDRLSELLKEKKEFEYECDDKRARASTCSGVKGRGGSL